MKINLIFLIVLMASFNVKGQELDSAVYENPSSINEVIDELGGDSVKFYYDDRYTMVKPFCATIFRISTIDTNTGNFNGIFTDYFKDSVIALKGNYINGKKEGLFTLFYSNGQIEQTGNYVNNTKEGIWKYYYADGSSHQTLLFADDDIRVEEFWDENGKKFVESGNGFWYGYETAEKWKKTSGKVVNGKKDGEWNLVFGAQDTKLYSENYVNGKMVGGKIYSTSKGIEKYKDLIVCKIEQPPHFLLAELFQIGRCERNIISNRKPAIFPGGLNRFTDEVLRKLNLTAPVNRVQTIRISIKIDENGNMDNFKALSNTGFEYDVINVLKTMDKWEPSTINGKPQIENRVIVINLR